MLKIHPVTWRRRYHIRGR